MRNEADAFRKQLQAECLAVLERRSAADHRAVLMRARLCAELACKVAIGHAWSASRAAEAMAGVSLQDLLYTVQRNGLMPPDLLSALHVLRSAGNKAAHGEAVGAHDAELGVAALRVVMQRLHDEVIHAPLPKAVRDAFGSSDPLSQLKREREELLHAQAIKQQERDKLEAEQRAKAAELDRVAQERDARLRAIEDRINEQLKITDELSRSLAQAQPLAAMPSVADKPIARRGRWPWVAALVVIVMASVWWAMDRDRTIPASSPVALLKDEFRVLVIPFAVLQDNPMLEVGIHDALRKRLNDRAALLPLPLTVVIDSARGPVAITEEEAISRARDHRVRIVLYGEVVEPTATDSGTIELRWADTLTAQSYKGTLKPRAFRTLADSAAIKTLLAAHTITELSMAYALFQAKRDSEALAMLYTTPVVTPEGLTSVQLYRAIGHHRAGELPPAMRELEAVLAREPNNAYANSRMGFVLDANGNSTAAIGFYAKAVMLEPSNADWCLALARLVGDIHDPANLDRKRSKELIMQAFRADSSRADVWDAMGQVALYEKRVGEAQRRFERALRIDSAFTGAQHNLAEVLAVFADTLDMPRAESLLRNVLRADSSRTHAALLLAQVLRAQKKEPDLADRLFRKSKQEDPQFRQGALRG
ncbi:MAG: DUF4145 domain-containing protein, partial [Flavobacteriales bacterium]